MEPSFDITERDGADGAVLLALSGELDMATVGELADRLDEAARRKESIVLDLSDLDFMDSSALRLFMQATGRASLDGWSFALSRPSPQIRRLFEVAGMLDFLPLLEP